MDWAISEKDNLSANMAIHHFANRTVGNTDQYLTQFDNLGNVLSEINNLRFSDNKFDVNTLDNSLSYTKKLAKEKFVAPSARVRSRV